MVTPVCDDAQLSVDEYRTKLYDVSVFLLVSSDYVIGLLIFCKIFWFINLESSSVYFVDVSVAF